MEETLFIEDELIELDGFITFYKYENEEENYRIALFKMDDNKQERTITIVGYFPHYQKNDGLTLKGKIIRHRKFGLQVEVAEIYKKLPTSKKNIIHYLSSTQFKHVGKKCAEAIFEFLKEDCITIMIENPNIYDEMINKQIINEKQKESLIEGLKRFNYTSNAYHILIKNGFSLKNIMKAESTYNEKLDEVIQSNPYQMIEDIDGIGFKSVDKMALNMGIDEHDLRRVSAATLYALMNLCHQSGDTCVYKNDLYLQLSRLININEDEFEESLNILINNKKIIVEDGLYFHYTLYQAELDIARLLNKFIKRKINKSNLNQHFEEMILQIQEDEGIKYSQEQKDAIYGALSNGLFIITGGPGTGKTTILNAILKHLTMLYGEEAILALCAPTGRASKRMSQLSNHYACTIHRLLKWDLHSNSFAYNENNQLKCDVIIIDEFSMVDTLLFSALLKGTKDVSQIILIGDDNQLPSVGAGNLLHDLLKIKQISKLSLSHIYRQSDGSSIVDLAYAIRYNHLDETFQFKNDVLFKSIKNYNAAPYIVSLLQRAFDSGLTFDDIQIIVPMYGNVAGIDNINAIVQEWYNPKKEGDIELKIGHQIFRIGDRVLQLKNQPEDDIYNGDIGVIKDIDLNEEEIVVEFDVGDVVYNKSLFANLTLAYAISIHKSQGSEFDFVIMCVFNDYGMMLNKPLLYTGITRAKKSLILLGDYFTFLKKAKIENLKIRKTTLCEKINYFIE